MAVRTLAATASADPPADRRQRPGLARLGDQGDQHRQEQDHLDPLAEDRHQRVRERQARTSPAVADSAPAQGRDDLAPEPVQLGRQLGPLQARVDPPPDRVEPRLQRRDLLRPSGR